MPEPRKAPLYLQAVQATDRLRACSWLGLPVAVAMAGGAFALRIALDPLLPPGFPYLTFFPAVILTAFFFGLRPGVLCAVLSGVLAWYFFIPPLRSFELTPQSALTLAFYAFIVTIDIGLIHFMQRAAERLVEEQKLVSQLYEQQRTMFQELQHRVANNMQFVASLLAIQKRRVRENKVDATRALDDAQKRLETISRTHRRLYDPARIDMPVGPYLQELCSDVLSASGARNIVCLVDTPEIRFDLPQLTTVSLLIVEVVTNAIKHAFDADGPGTVSIRLERLDPKQLKLVIADDGKGLPPAFDPAASTSLGWRICQSLAGQLNGKLTYASRGGTQVSLVFPAAAAG